jgi:hypothetical protein
MGGWVWLQSCWRWMISIAWFTQPDSPQPQSSEAPQTPDEWFTWACRNPAPANPLQQQDLPMLLERLEWQQTARNLVEARAANVLLLNSGLIAAAYQVVKDPLIPLWTRWIVIAAAFVLVASCACLLLSRWSLDWRLNKPRAALGSEHARQFADVDVSAVVDRLQYFELRAIVDANRRLVTRSARLIDSALSLLFFAILLCVCGLVPLAAMSPSGAIQVPKAAAQELPAGPVGGAESRE